MKSFFKVTVAALAILMAVPPAYSQKSNKELKKDLKAKVYKDSKKEAKKLTKEGWKVMPGKLPLERQIQDSKFAELDEDKDGNKLYFVGQNQSDGGNYTAAKQIATSRATLELARTLNTFMAEKVREKQATNDYGDGDLETVAEFISANSSIAEARLQGVVPVLEMYKENKDRTYTVNVVVKVNAEEALKHLKKAYMAELKKESDKLAGDLDAVMPF